MISLEFFVTSLLVILIPGTGVIYTVSTGLTGSRKETLAAAAGCTLGITPHLTAGILGLSAILHMSALVFQGIKIIGVAYLLYLGWGMLTDKNKLNLNEKNLEESPLKIIIKGILINLLNPKLTLFFFSFLPQFIQNGDRGGLLQMTTLGLIFMGLTLIIFIFYGILANSFKSLVIKSPGTIRRFQQTCGVAFFALAAKLVLSDE